MQHAINGFRKAQILKPSETSVDDDSDLSDSDDDAEADILPEDVAGLFHSDTEDEEFEGFRKMTLISIRDCFVTKIDVMCCGSQQSDFK